MMGLAPQLAAFAVPGAKEHEIAHQQLAMLGIFTWRPGAGTL